MNSSTLSILSGVAAAAWSVWTWQKEQDKARSLKRDEMSAQYVNTQIVATQELQRKLYKILEENELSFYKGQDSQSPSSVAIELLYHLSLFFGWTLVTFRYGPYTRDPRMISHVAKIAEILESRSIPGEAFRFSLSDRLAIAEASVKREGETELGPNYYSVSRFSFEADFREKTSTHARMFASKEVSCTLAAIDRAVSGSELEGKERLAALQNELLELLSYLEEQEGFRISYGERGRVSRLQEHELDQILSRMEVRVAHQIPGRLRLSISELRHDSKAAETLANTIKSMKHVRHVRVNPLAASLLIEYDETVSSRHFLGSIRDRLSRSALSIKLERSQNLAESSS